MAKTGIVFVSGLDPVCPVPREATAAGLTHRFAIVQETHRADSPDMVFDAPLYRALLAFAGLMAPGAIVTVSTRSGRLEYALAEHLAEWEAQAQDDRGAEVIVLARVGGELAGCIAPENWGAVGGPMPYADSHTYSIFTKDDVGVQVMAYLAGCDAAVGWDMADHVIPAPDRGPAWKRLLGRLLS